ncbi:MAG: cupin domain-containing protein [Clostridium sp.]|nr:cupin domain-containing protein [Clostridium sp.]
MDTHKGANWVFGRDTKGDEASPGVERRVLAYCDELMCVENVFQKGSIGAMHHHPHTQITYVASGRFRFTIGDQTREVTAGDTLLKQNDILHGCECLEDGILVDFFTPMRKDFVQD